MLKDIKYCMCGGSFHTYNAELHKKVCPYFRKPWESTRNAQNTELNTSGAKDVPSVQVGADDAKTGQ
jgi:hypothetical protein